MSEDQSSEWSTRTAPEVPFRPALASLAVLTGVVAFVLASTVFPHHSANHDEGVYLQQAAMLLEGKLWMTTAVPDAVHPWFFVEDGSRLYPKYLPVSAAVFAVGMAAGVPRLSLAIVAATTVALLGLLVADAFDESTGLLAAGFFVASPLFLVQSAVFLSYVPTTTLNLGFAVAYVRAVRRQSRRWAGVAGVAIGLAFFSRPYTAVLFALPFVGYALWRLADAAGGDAFRSVLTRQGTVATGGLAFVGVTLAYNAVVTGSPFLFPYQAFAPADGLGFGHHEILGYDRTYTPALAVEANARVLWQFATNWTAVPPAGTVAALVGLGVHALSYRGATPATGPHDSDGASSGPLADRTLGTLLAAVAGTVVAGNVYFWGNLNVLAALDDPSDGLISLLGPFYHVDLLVPFAAFAAAGTLAVGRGLHAAIVDRRSPEIARLVLAVLLVVALPIGGVVESEAVGERVDRNLEYTERYDRAYAPFEDRTFSNALVFLPTPYGEWLNHPFQSLRNDPSLDGSVVYVLDRDPAEDAATLAAFPNRTVYRYTYRGVWSPTPADDDPVVPKLERLRVRNGSAHRMNTTVGRVAGVESTTVRLAAGDDVARYEVVRLPPETLSLQWRVDGNSVRVTDPAVRPREGNGTVPVEGPTEVALSVTFTQYGGATVTYRQELTVLPGNSAVRVVWPPETRVCRLTPDCGHEGTYVEDADDYVGGVSVNATVATEP